MSRQFNKPVRKGLYVEVREGNINQALRKLKTKMDDAGKLEEVRAKMFYEKPTTKRKRKAGAAKARWRKALRDQSLPKKLF
jgi:small subunit ribosomal protein S21